MEDLNKSYESKDSSKTPEFYKEITENEETQCSLVDYNHKKIEEMKVHFFNDKRNEVHLIDFDSVSTIKCLKEGRIVEKKSIGELMNLKNINNNNFENCISKCDESKLKCETHQKKFISYCIMCEKIFVGNVKEIMMIIIKRILLICKKIQMHI